MLDLIKIDSKLTKEEILTKAIAQVPVVTQENISVFLDARKSLNKIVKEKKEEKKSLTKDIDLAIKVLEDFSEHIYSKAMEFEANKPALETVKIEIGDSVIEQQVITQKTAGTRVAKDIELKSISEALTPDFVLGIKVKYVDFSELKKYIKTLDLNDATVREFITNKLNENGIKLEETSKIVATGR
jgi:hypothetical protein